MPIRACGRTTGKCPAYDCRPPVVETIKASGQESRLFHEWGGRYAKAVNTNAGTGNSYPDHHGDAHPFQFLKHHAIYLLGGIAVINAEMSIATMSCLYRPMTDFGLSNSRDLRSLMQTAEADLKRSDDEIPGAQVLIAVLKVGHSGR